MTACCEGGTPLIFYRINLTALFVLFRFFVLRLFASGLFRMGFFVFLRLAGGFFAAMFLVPFLRAAGFFAPEFVTPFRLATGQLDAAQGAAERLDFALVVVFLMLGQFDEFQDLFHLLKRLLEGFHDMADFIGGFANGGKVLFLAGPVEGRPFVTRRFDRRPFPGRRFDRRRFREFFLRRRFKRFVCGGRRRGRLG